MLRETLKDGTVLYLGRSGCAVFQRLAKGVLLITPVGEFDTLSPEHTMREFENEMEAAGSLSLYINLLERKTAASTTRKAWSEWARKNRDRIRSHVLVRSKIVDMAISVIAMLAGGMPVRSYSNVAEFEASIAREVPGFRKLPPVPARARATMQPSV
jgi:hypothetical protein